MGGKRKGRKIKGKGEGMGEDGGRELSHPKILAWHLYELQAESE